MLDNPVGAGYSYVNESLGANYTTNVQQITDDLVSFAKQFIGRFPQFSVRRSDKLAALRVARGRIAAASWRIRVEIASTKADEQTALYAGNMLL